jgi:hypothetical protein
LVDEKLQSWRFWMHRFDKYNFFIFFYIFCLIPTFILFFIKVNALKAILEFEKLYSKTIEANVKVLLNGTEIQTFSFNNETLKGIKVGEPFELVSFGDKLTQGGDFELSLLMETDNKETIVRIPYSVDIFYCALQPDDHPNVQLDLLTELSNSQLKEGEGTGKICLIFQFIYFVLLFFDFQKK